MSNVYLQQGDIETLNVMRLNGNLLNTLRLFQNNHVPAVGDTNANYTEATFSGYAAVALGTWNAAYLNGSNKGETDADVASFAHNGGGVSNTIYGAYVTDNVGNVIYAEAFSAPVVMAAVPNTITYTARLTAVSE